MALTSHQIRQQFIDFFCEKHGHTHVPSSRVVLHDDPTLLFVNAGMNQFRDVFLGRGERPYVRAVNSQKCIRAGGKHNDLEDVGRDTYHHTFFEMLGNWSFGDYFKQEAITWAWELLTSENLWGLDPQRLHVTVYEGGGEEGLQPDIESEEIWRQLLPAEHITRWPKEHNFWEMGETGPCGPCSEVHYDCTSDCSGGGRVNQDDPSVIEIWNLVFIQYYRDERGGLSPLPEQHVDTGLGFERITRVLQQKDSNYDTDIWSGLFETIRDQTGVRPYGGILDDPIDRAYRVVADHARCLVIALADGADPGNEGRGYVLRRILRRAVRHLHQQFDLREPGLFRIVPTVIDGLKEACPELVEAEERVTALIHTEEEGFLRTIDRGMALFEKDVAVAEETGLGAISAAQAFLLHDTFGFPVDLTRIMAEERGLEVDESGYELLMDAARERSRARGEKELALLVPPDVLGRIRNDGTPATDISSVQGHEPVDVTVMALWGGELLEEVATGAEVSVITDRSNHYAESGGQVSDHGVLTTGQAGVLDITDVQRCGDYVLHLGTVREGMIRVGDRAKLACDFPRRESIMANHTCTHLLNHALRAVIGSGVDQRGSLVASDRLRFDYATTHPPDMSELAEIESRVRNAVAGAHRVHAGVVPLEQARGVHGLRAVFGEQYPDPVRVVSIGVDVDQLLQDPSREEWVEHSIEFCGGTHLDSTAKAGVFILMGESALAAGIRRITAVTGPVAEAVMAESGQLRADLERAAAIDDHALDKEFDALVFRVDNAVIGMLDRQWCTDEVACLRQRVGPIRRTARGAARAGAAEAARSIADTEKGPVIVATIDSADKDVLLAALDVIRSCHVQSSVMIMSGIEDSKVSIAARVPEHHVASGLHAGDWVKIAAEVCGGGGGGRADMAMAGGRDPGRIPDAIEAARAYAGDCLREDME